MTKEVNAADHPRQALVLERRDPSREVVRFYVPAI
jgi:hypothetical protein